MAIAEEGIPANGKVEEERVIVVNGDEHEANASAEKRYVIHDNSATADSGDRLFTKKLDVENIVHNDKDGTVRRQLKLRGGDDGQNEGTLEIEVHRQ